MRHGMLQYSSSSFPKSSTMRKIPSATRGRPMMRALSPQARHILAEMSGVGEAHARGANSASACLDDIYERYGLHRVRPEAFSYAVECFHEMSANPYRGYVTSISTKNFSGICFLDDMNKAGIAIRTSGDIIGMFNGNEQRRCSSSPYDMGEIASNAMAGDEPTSVPLRGSFQWLVSASTMARFPSGLYTTCFTKRSQIRISWLCCMTERMGRISHKRNWICFRSWDMRRQPRIVTCWFVKRANTDT